MGSGFSKYDRKLATHSRYCYPGIEVLINKDYGPLTACIFDVMENK